MGANGLLLLTSSTRTLLSSSSRLRCNLIAASNRIAAGVLYVFHWLPPPPKVAPVLPQPGPSGGLQVTAGGTSNDTANHISKYSGISSRVYSQGQQYCGRADIRFLYERSLDSNIHPTVPIDLVFVEMEKGHDVSVGSVKEFVCKNFLVTDPEFEIQFINAEEDVKGTSMSKVGNVSAIDENDPASSGATEERLKSVTVDDTVSGVNVLPVPFPRVYPKVAIGGTFDRMHIAHKILIMEAVLRCSDELIVGVTVDEMIKSKLLYELIEPYEKRIERVSNFLRDVAPRLNSRVVPISDPFGPTVHEKDIELLVVSNESIKGGMKINEIRKSKEFPELDVYAIDLYQENEKESEFEEDKISSSSQRIRILGDRIRPPRKSPSLPYIIGLTGGICSGKSTLCSYLETLGIPSINCDALGHEAYKKGTQCFQQVVDTFGENVLTDSKDEINRRALGAKVFSSQSELSKLNGIVWPEIRSLIVKKIQTYAENGSKAIVLDAAILLEAGWDELCHDVWVVIIPKEQAIKRVQNRDKLSEADAEKRVLSQVSNHERVERATFVFSSLWEHDFTRRQANKAWTQIKSLIDTL